MYNNFEQFNREAGQSIGDYKIEFERLYYLIRKHKKEIPEAILAFKLLNKAGLNHSEKQLALTATRELKLENMKSALKRIFGESDVAHGSNQSRGFGVTVKQEAFFTNSQNRGYNTVRGSKRGRYTGTMDRQRNVHDRQDVGTNPLDRNGRRSRCAVCSSTFHWARDCEHKDKVKNGCDYNASLKNFNL